MFSQSILPTSSIWIWMQDAYFLSYCLILYVVTKLYFEVLSKDEGDIKHNILIMLKHLILLHPSPLSPTRCHHLFQLSLLFYLVLIFLLSCITRTSRCWDFESRIKTIPGDLKQIFPPTFCIFIISSLEKMLSSANNITQTVLVSAVPS